MCIRDRHNAAGKAAKMKKDMEKETIIQNANSGNAIVIAGGGTGGHIFPAIAIANALKQLDPNARFLFVGARGKMEMERVPQAGYEIVGLDIAGFNRSSLLKNIALPYKLVKLSLIHI